MDIAATSLRLLEKWLLCAQRDIHGCPGRPDLKYYGDGSNGWGTQTNQKAFAALAVMAADPALDERAAGMTRDELLCLALAMLRYSLESHIVGSYHTTDSDGTKWGHTWISFLGVHRMFHGIDAIWEHLTPYDHNLLGKMLISEADWQLENNPVKAGLTQDNSPERNMWNGPLLLMTALLYPQTKNADAYRDRGIKLLLNSISVPSDAKSRSVFDGKLLSDEHVGANFFESYACNHHRYMNVGYMVITLSNLAMTHFFYRKRGTTAPEALYLHFEKLWQLVSMCIFQDGRLNRIGGDSRVRYCYCQDYLLPVMLLVKDTLGEDCGGLEAGWLEILEKEMRYNGDGSFLSKRCELFVQKSPLYYTRLESDRAVSLSYEVYWRRVFNGLTAVHGTGGYVPEPSWRENLTFWYDEYHGSFYLREPERLASFVWEAAEKPQGGCVPPSDSSLAEWRFNMAGSVCGDGTTQFNTILYRSGEAFEGGFVTAGRFRTYTDNLLAEQINGEDIADTDIAFAALPDGATVVVLERARALKFCHLGPVKGLYLNIPNDVFNDFSRVYSRPDKDCLVVDSKLAVKSIYGGGIELHCPPYRQIGIKGKDWFYKDRGMLRCDEACITLCSEPRWYDKGELIFDLGAAISTAGYIPPAKAMSFPDVNIKGVCVTGRNGIEYRVIANFGDAAAFVDGTELNAGAAKVIPLVRAGAAK